MNDLIEPTVSLASIPATRQPDKVSLSSLPATQKIEQPQVSLSSIPATRQPKPTKSPEEIEAAAMKEYEKAPDVKELLGGPVEAAGAFTSGMFYSTVGILATPFLALGNLVRRSQTPVQDAQRQAQTLVERLVYRPHTEEGRALTALANQPFETVDRTLDAMLTKIGLSAETKAGAKAGIYAGLAATGLMRPKAKPQGIQVEGARIEKPSVAEPEESGKPGVEVKPETAAGAPLKSVFETEQEALAAKLQKHGIEEGSEAWKDIMGHARDVRRDIDPLTGMQTRTEFAKALPEIFDRQKQSGEPMSYGVVDIVNVGGLNKAFGKAKADVHIKAISDIIKRAFDEEGIRNRQDFRNGGDEFQFVAPVDQTAQYRALEKARGRVAEYAQANGLDAIPHAKGGPAGTGIIFHVEDFKDWGDAKALEENADLAVEFLKEDFKHGRREIEAPGPVAPEGQARRTESGIKETPRRIGKEAPTEAEEVAHPETDLLYYIRQRIEAGQPGERGAIDYATGKPEWFKGLKRNDYLPLIDKALSGKNLTDIQAQKLADLMDSARGEYSREAAKAASPVPSVMEGEQPVESEDMAYLSRVLGSQRGGVEIGRVADYINKSQHEVEYSGNLLDDYYKLKGADAADTNRMRQVLEHAQGSPEDYEAIYHNLEDPSSPLTAKQKALLETEIKPIREAREKVYRELQKQEVPLAGENYTPRKAANRGGLFDRLKTGFRGTREGSALGKTTGALKRRVMMKVEDEAGHTRIVSIKKGEVTAWINRKPESMGRLKFTDFEQMLDEELSPIDRKISKIDRELEIVEARQSREWKYKDRLSELRRNEKIAELEQQREAILESYNPNDLKGKLFVDKEGTTWRIGEATTKEIEANTNLRYHKNALLNEITTLNNLRRVQRAVDYLENLKRTPEFNEMAIKLGTQNLPEGYTTTVLPQFRGYAFPKRIAETFDTFYKKAATGLLDPESAYRIINRVLRNSIFFNPLIHIPNISVHWLVQRGATPWLDPRSYPRLMRTSVRAIRDVLTMNENYNKMLEEGASLMYSETANRNLYKLMLDKMGGELEAKPSLLTQVAKDLGLAPARLVKAIYNFSSKATWATNDVATLQAIYEEMDRGKSMETAITDVGKHIPTYRIPPRIMNSKTIANLMKPDSGVTMFGAYHYGALKSYGEMIKSLIGKGVETPERLEAIDKIAMLALTTYVIYPQLDKLAQWISGNPQEQFRRAGASTFLYKTEQLIKGDIDFASWVQSVLTPSVGFNVAIQAYYGRDPRTGKRISYPQMAMRSISPVAYAERLGTEKLTTKDFLLSLAGMSKGKSEAEKEMFKIYREQEEAREKQSDTKNRLRKALGLDLDSGLDALYKAVDEGKISEAGAAKLQKEAEAGMSDLQRRFKNLKSKNPMIKSVDLAFQIFEKMNKDERAQTAVILMQMVDRFIKKHEDSDPESAQAANDRLNEILDKLPEDEREKYIEDFEAAEEE